MLKACILGCAHMHAYGYVEALIALDVCVTGAYDDDVKIANPVCERYDIKRFENLDEAFATSPDIVVICSENINHKKFTLEAASRGVHVIVEKPIATNEADALDMIKACEENGVLLMVAFPVRYADSFLNAKKIIDEGRLGRIISIVATNHGSMPGGWFTNKSLSGGGCVIDHTVHVADIMNHVLKQYGEVRIGDVSAAMGNLIHKQAPCEDCGIILAELFAGEHRVIASIDTSWNRPKSYPVWGDVVMDFIGDKGSLRVDGFIPAADKYADNVDKHYTRFDVSGDMNFNMIRDFIDAVKNKRTSPVSGEDGLFATRIALKAYEFCSQ